MQRGRSSHAFEAGFNEDPGGLSGAAEVVHDLGNLIQIAASAVNMIARSPRISHDSGLDSILARAKASLESAGALVRQTVGRGATALTKVSQESVDLSACVGEIQSLIAWVCTPDITLTSDIAPNLPPVSCSALDLQNALLNLLINARDAMPEGGEISITGRCREFGAAVEFAVRDNGLGMDTATRLRAFNPWFTTKSEGRGSGLGLAMVKRFADDAGGRVDIWSAPGVGTTVTLYLPTAEPEPVSDDSQR
jgi:signal transduction histidine kinase